MIKLKTEKEILELKIGGGILARVLREAKDLVKPGVSTDEINTFVENKMKEYGVTSAFLNYTPDGAERAFPASLCLCVNDEIVHGIPNENPYIFKEGDVVTLDAGVIYNNLVTDHAITFSLNNQDKDIKKLLSKTEEALYAGIKQAVIGNHVGDIGSAISQIARAHDLTVINGLSGHGVGYSVHEDPYVPNEGEAGHGDILQEGLVIAIEPMFSLGSPDIVLEDDGYTLKTEDGSISAQYEHTIAITKNGPIILTK